MKIIFIFAALILLFGCNNDNLKDSSYDDDCDYSSCETVEPFYTDISIKFTRNAENPNPTIYLMNGYYDEGSIIDSIETDTVSGKIASKSVLLNFQYTVFIKYISGTDTIIAIDGDYVHKNTYNECDSICWAVYNTKFNLKLK